MPALRLRPGIPFLLALLAGAAAAAAQPAADSAAFVTMLGRDTLAVERWVRRGDALEAEAAVRSPRTALLRFRVGLGPDGRMRRFEEEVLQPSEGGFAPARKQVVERQGAAWVRRLSEGDSTRTERIEADAALLPFVELVFWPFDLALSRTGGGADGTLPLLAGGRVLDFRVARAGADSVTITHPFRGPSAARVDARNRILALDASETTRKVRVARLPWIAVEAHARRWAAADRAGRAVGELSGRAREEASVAGARLGFDYGTPLTRGREIFGRVVPWGQLWRTGANRATHLTTDRTLVLDDPGGDGLTLAPGEYTLFTIPEPGGGVLVVSRQTGQNGNAYDPAHDLGRVPMARVPLAAPVERFTIRAVPRGEGGVLLLVWDRSEFRVPFTVR